MNSKIIGGVIFLFLGYIGIFFWQKDEMNKIETAAKNKTEVSTTVPEKVIGSVKKPDVVAVEPEQTINKNKVPVKVSPTDTEKWGVSTQVGEHTWTIKVGEDSKMATAKEILDALNEYRKVHGSQILSLDGKLAYYAQQRADYLNSIKSLDQHAGFNNFVENEDGFNKLGFTALGENTSYGYRLNGVHIIEWMYAGDKPHNDNQLDSRWNYVGIGVKGLATCLIFGTGKM